MTWPSPVGFVLRAVAGGVAAPVGLSRWFVLVVTCAAVFVAAGKRLAELSRASGPRRARPAACCATTARRDCAQVLASAGAGALFAYCVWAFQLPDVGGIPWRPLTVIPFTVCLLRYGALVQAGVGEAPEEVLTRRPGDRAGRAGVAAAVRAERQCRWLSRRRRPAASPRSRVAPQW